MSLTLNITSVFCFPDTPPACIVESPYVNLQHPSIFNGGDYEALLDVISAAGFCQFPVGILCRDSLTKTFHDELNQVSKACYTIITLE